jgi:hypothetical protein
MEQSYTMIYSHCRHRHWRAKHNDNDIHSEKKNIGQKKTRNEQKQSSSKERIKDQIIVNNGST